MWLGAALFYLCAGLVLGYFDTLLSRIEHLAWEKIAETQRRVTVEEHQWLALELHDGVESRWFLPCSSARAACCDVRNGTRPARGRNWHGCGEG